MGLKIDRRAAKATKIAGVIVLVAIVACMIKILVWEHSYYQNKSAETRNPQQSVITSIEDAKNPSENEPTQADIDKYQTHTTSPRYLIIKRLNIKARVKDSSVNENTLPLPDDIFNVSWYSGSGNPGQGGNILISGVSEGATKHGVFSNLDSLEEGDEITIVRGDDETFKYSVREIMIIDKADAKDKLPIAQKRIDDKETVALVTVRRADENNDTFNSIVIVRATIK
jgi:LPXTG-site transpeptidase (sortase) family protein